MAIRLKDRVEANVRQSDKVNSSLSIQLNNGTATIYNGSTAKSINITPVAINAANKIHTHVYSDISGVSRAHLNTWNFKTQYDSNYVTFDVSAPEGGPGSWINGFVSTHNNYLSSYIVNSHRTSNWYVGYGEWGETDVTMPTWYKLLHSGNYTDYTVTKTGSGASGTWDIGITGNAATATTATKANQLTTARTISLTGAITGSGSFNGTGNLNIATSVNHTHNYLPLSGGILSGNLTIQNNNDIILKASSSNPNDPGDLVFAKGDGSEQCRIWTMTEGACYIRFGTDESRYTLIHTGNINNYIPIDAKFLGYFNLLPFSDINKYGTTGWETNGSTILSYRGSYNFYDTIALDGSSSTGGIKGKMWVRLKPNTVYTYSAIVHSLIAFSPTTSTPLHSWCAPTVGTVAHTDTQISVYPTTVPANTYTRLSVTFRTNSDPATYFLPIIYSIPATTQFCIGQISLVEGTVVPEYSPICIGDAWYKGEAIYGAVWN